MGPAYRYPKYDRIFRTPSKKFEFYSGNLERILRKRGEGNREKLNFLPHYAEVRFIGDLQKYPLILLTYQPLSHMENGSQNYPWAQEIFLVRHGVGWTNFVEVNSTTPTIHKIPLIPPLPKGEIVIPLFGKEGRGEIF